MEEKNFLPEISRDNLEKILKISDNQEFFYGIFDYSDYSIKLDEPNTLEWYSKSLVIYNYISWQVWNWWFSQMIYNWYWIWVFKDDFLENLEKIWLKKTVDLIKELKNLLKNNKEEFKKINYKDWKIFKDFYYGIEEKSWYDFDYFSDKFYEIEESELEILVNFIKSNLDEFFTLVD